MTNKPKIDYSKPKIDYSKLEELSQKAEWFLRNPGDAAVHGPYYEHQLIEYAREGRVSRTSELKHVTTTQGAWIPAKSIPAIAKLIPPEFVAFKNVCPFCKSELVEGAVKCRYCGEFTDGRVAQEPFIIQAAPVAKMPKWSPGVAAVLSLVIPGAGQMYKGDVIGGFIWLFVVGVAYGIGIEIGAPLFLPAVLLHICCVCFAPAGDPAK